MDTVTLTIDGRQLTVPKGKTVLQAAIENGIKVPYYCYHPALGVDGSCRVCLVKIEKMPKLQVSCSVTATDGMVVYTQAPEVVEARAGVFEFLLINHPLDCPVCDKGGECPLQDFSYTFGPDQSRMEFPRRTFDGEGVRADVDFGPTLMLNRNRCILCTRCVRFMRDIDGDPQISITDRGYGSEISTFREEGVHSILSGNLMDVCPVGAILTKDYRFRSRPWDNPHAVDTICTLCEKGCNITAWIKAKPEWAKGPKLARITPRFNPDVNGYWMCDIGRFDYHWVESDRRLVRPLVRSANGLLEPRSWDDALAAVRAAVPGEATSGLQFLLTAHASHEEMFVLGRVAQELLGPAAENAVSVTWTSSYKPQPERTKFKVPEVNAPNLAGARALGLVPADATHPDLARLRQAVDAGSLSALYVFDPGPDGSAGDLSWAIEARRSGKLRTLIVQGPLLTAVAEAADIVLPGAAWVEKEATYTNMQGRLQATARVLTPPGEARDDWQILTQVGTALGAALQYASAADIRADLAATMSGEATFEGIDRITFARPVTARHWLQASNPSERWKWDFMFQDLPPVKFAGMPLPSPKGAEPQNVIPLRKVE